MRTGRLAGGPPGRSRSARAGAPASERGRGARDRRRAAPLLAALALTGLTVAGRLLAPAGAAAPELATLGFQPYAVPRPAPAFTLPDLDGVPRTLAALRGKLVLLFFWATW